MNSNVKMNISPIVKKGENKMIYVQFMDDQKKAEFSVPGCQLIKNDGFDDTDIESLKEYLESQADEVMAIAKQINPITAMMK